MKIHPHMLRHACGYKLANDGVDTRTIQAQAPQSSEDHPKRRTPGYFSRGSEVAF